MENTKKKGMRTGFTTGACSAAAARAATLALVHGEVPNTVECTLPNGQRVMFAVSDGRRDDRCAHAMVIKDAGDDPDCTQGAHLTADVCLRPDLPGQVLLVGGFGVGTVTMPGLGLDVGGPAINPVPRRNIEENVRAVAGTLLDQHGLEVTISVPQGVAMSKKTLNARLGIIGGISILGTTTSCARTPPRLIAPVWSRAFRSSLRKAKTRSYSPRVGVRKNSLCRNCRTYRTHASCKWAIFCAMP